MQVICLRCMVATHVQSVLRTQGVSVTDFIGPQIGDPTITVMVNQNISVDKEPTIRREIQQIVGATIPG
jgi:hypothetical protein